MKSTFLFLGLGKLALEGLYIEFLTRHQELLARLPTSCATVKHLKLDLYPDKKPIEVVMFLLRRYPNLQTLCISIKTLSLTSMGNVGGQILLEELNSQSMLKCLRKVEIKYFGGSGSELDLVRFLLGNGSVMKEMDITYSRHKRADKATRTFLNDMVLAFTKVSPDVAISFS
ncbi:hypothetical protein IFM89_036159 [Coptis chinensis]|uniref:FBD domain-containing protein n=1 Tax=Coptis chinensis TaxID=261450 RepID=A0A835H2X5_9MAGN|nr:hypothetical protein IFM89_036159 [Coptis chinensis]